MKFCNECKKKINTNGNYCFMCGTQLVSKKKTDVFNILSIISIILVVIVIVINSIFIFLMSAGSDDPTGAGQALGFAWAFIGIIPSTFLLFVSIVMAIISIVSYFISIIRKVKINMKKKILVIINIIQIILIIIGLIALVNWWNKESIQTDEGLDYTVEEINEMFIDTDEKYSINEININNVRKFNQLLSYIDSIIGRDNYYIGSIYITKIPHNNYARYVVKIIPKEYIEQYNSWSGNFSLNPYLVMFTMETDPEISYEWHEGMYDNYYQTFILGMKYKEELEKEFSSLDSRYKYIVDYNALLYISTVNLGINSNSTWQDGLEIFKTKSTSNLPSMFVIAPYGTTEEDGEKFVEDNKEIFNKYYVQGVTLCVLKESETVTDYINISKYDEKFEIYYSFRIN